MAFQTWDIRLPRIFTGKLNHDDPYESIALLDEEGTPIVVQAITATSDEAGAVNLRLNLGDGNGGDLWAGEIPAGAGYGAVKPVDIMAELPANLQAGFTIPHDGTLSFSLGAGVSEDKTVTVLVLGGEA